MPDWVERQRAYRNHERPNSQNVEDLLAHRLLRGLGVSSSKADKQLYLLERMLLGRTDGTEPLYVRAVPVVLAALQLAGRSDLAQHLRMMPTEAKSDAQVVEELRSCINADPLARVCYLVRVPGTRVCVAYCLWDAVIDLERLVAPFTVVERIGGKLVVKQELGLFIEQFGPFPFEVQDEN